MSAPFGPLALTLDDITRQIRSTFDTFTDLRTGKNKTYTMTDAGLSAFSVFFMQSPSFLEHQRTLELAHGENNARTLFGVHEIPSDNQIRTLLDPTPPSMIKPVYASLFNALRESGVVDAHRSLNGSLLLAFDGTEYFSSKCIHCGQCSTRQHANGTVTHFHTAVTPVLVKPVCEKVIPLAPEFVAPQDGSGKQDCEINAAKRWLAAHGEAYGRLNTTVLGDDLYCHEPYCLVLRSYGLRFVLAFLTHTVLDWGDGKFQLLRQKLPSRRRLFDDIKALTSYLCFDSWDALTDFMLESFKKPAPPKPETG